MEKKKKKNLSTSFKDAPKSLRLLLIPWLKKLEREWDAQRDDYSKKLVELCCTKALAPLCGAIDDGSFDMMLAWEMTTSADEQSHSESLAKERDEKKVPVVTNNIQDDVSLFYSDLMPLLVSGKDRLPQKLVSHSVAHPPRVHWWAMFLSPADTCPHLIGGACNGAEDPHSLVDREPSAGEDAFVWLGRHAPLVVDMVNGRFTFETLTAPMASRLHFPAYDKFLKEIQRCIRHLQKQDTPTGVKLLEDEFILHVEGTASSDRVVQHIGGTSWPGVRNRIVRRRTQNRPLKGRSAECKACSNRPLGCSSVRQSYILRIFRIGRRHCPRIPELTSSTRRGHWLDLVEEIMILHRFLLKFKKQSPLEVWELHARTMLGIIRLHVAREMLRILPPEPKSFLIFSLLDELPKGDYILQELAESLKTITGGNPCSASVILRSLNVSQPCLPCLEPKQIASNNETVQQPENLSSLENAIKQSREEAKEVDLAKATASELKEEGISESAQVLVPRGFNGSYSGNGVITFLVIVSSLMVIYKEWVGPAISTFLLWIVAKMLQVRSLLPDKINRIVIRGGSDQSTMENIVTAQQALRSVHDMMKQMNITLLKVWSILISEAPKHTNIVIVGMSCSAIIPFKFILMGLVVYGGATTLRLRKPPQNEQGNRRMREWWDSIPVIPVRLVEEEEPATTSQSSD